MDDVTIKGCWLNVSWFRQKPSRLLWLLDLIHSSDRGELVTSLGELSSLWHISRDEVRWFLSKLGELGIANTQTTHKSRTKSTHITFCNSGDCVSVTHTTRTQSAHETHTNDAQEKPKTESKEKPRRDRPNGVQEVRDYVKEKGYHFNPDEFFAFYESSNWHRGKTKITNWKQCCVTWETTYKKEHRDSLETEESNRRLLDENKPKGKGSYGAVIHYIADHSVNIVRCVPLPTEDEVGEISLNYKDFFQQAVKNMDADPNLSKQTFWGAFVKAIQLTKRTIDYGTTQLAREESARIKRNEQLRAYQDARDESNSGAFFGDY